MARYNGPIIDVDIHHRWLDPEEVVRYLPNRWKDYVRSDPGRIIPPSFQPCLATNAGRLLDALEPGLTRGTDESKLHEMLLDKFDVVRVILTHDNGQYGAQSNPEFAVDICRAMNDWNIAEWLPRDERFYSVIVIPTGSPEDAAAEIHRVGDHPRLVSVMLAGNTLGRPFGDPVYDPIYRAATDHGLHMAMHFGGSDRPGTALTATGGHFTGISFSALLMQQAEHYLSSFITNGTFEKFPDLKILMKEYGQAWLPSLMLRLDDAYDLMREESSWVKRWPSEYLRDHLKLSTQPLEEGRTRQQLLDIFALVDGIEDMLCFSSDWPHWSADDPGYVARQIPESWRRKVMCENACDFFGWGKPEELYSLAPAAGVA
jgi:predicted TIM-barrel fold metal-dependent hydrolase